MLLASAHAPFEFLDARQDLTPHEATRRTELAVKGVEQFRLTRLHAFARTGQDLLGRVGDSYDNALAETVNGLYKAEVIHCQSWNSLWAVELATLTWVGWFNRRRLLAPIGYVPPAVAEADYDRQTEPATMAA